MIQLEGACVTLVDTQVPGWQLMYASKKWEQWTGGDVLGLGV